MSRAPLPAFHDDLDACFAEAWRLLAEGVERGRSGFHLPALATLDPAGAPRVRTVVLRAVDRGAGTLRFHCDRRSAKADEIARNGACALMAYDGETSVQIRAEGQGSLHTGDALAEAAWAAAQPMSRVCYGTVPGPGIAIPEGGAYALPDADEALRLGRPHFAAVVVRVASLDFLYLDRRGHRRARWDRAGAAPWTGRWLVP